MHLITLALLAFALPQQAPTEDLTFLVVSDTHYGQDQWADNEAQNKAVIDRMNAIPGTAWPASVGGGVVDTPRGVLVPGDLTDTGEYTNWNGYWFFGWIDGFRDDYALGGQGRIAWEVYEGYGNHDIHSPADGTVLAGIQSRNTTRADVVNVSSNGLHYSFDWPLGDTSLHLVNLNVYPGAAGDAENSLDFLVQDLASEVGTTGRPIVLYHHYGFDSFSNGWWTAAERDAYGQAIASYNVIAIFHGHTHGTFHRIWNDIDVFSIANAKAQAFYVVRVTPTQLTVVQRRNDTWSLPYMIDIWSGGARADFRNGRGVNPALLTSLNLPVLGTIWETEIDGGAIGATGLSFLAGYSAPLDPGTLLGWGELLIDPTSSWMVTSIVGGAHGVCRHSLGIPADPALNGLTFSVQGFLNNVMGFSVLTNAYDVVLGL